MSTPWKGGWRRGEEGGRTGLLGLPAKGHWRAWRTCLPAPQPKATWSTVGDTREAGGGHAGGGHTRGGGCAMGDTRSGALKGGKLRTVEALSTLCRQQRFRARVGCVGRVWAAVQSPAGPVVWPESRGSCTGYSPHPRVVREAGLASEGAAGLVREDVAGLTPVSRRAADVEPPENCPTDSVPTAHGPDTPEALQRERWGLPGRRGYGWGNAVGPRGPVLPAQVSRSRVNAVP